MKPLSTFFSKFRILAPPERYIKQAAREAVLKIVGVEVPGGDVKIVRDTILFQTSSVVKSEIMLHEQEILDEINKTLQATKRRIKTLH